MIGVRRVYASGASGKGSINTHISHAINDLTSTHKPHTIHTLLICGLFISKVFRPLAIKHSLPNLPSGAKKSKGAPRASRGSCRVSDLRHSDLLQSAKPCQGGRRASYGTHRVSDLRQADVLLSLVRLLRGSNVVARKRCKGTPRTASTSRVETCLKDIALQRFITKSLVRTSLRVGEERGFCELFNSRAGSPLTIKHSFCTSRQRLRNSKILP